MGYALVFRAASADEFRARVAADPVVAAFRDAGGGEPTPEVADTVARTALAMGEEAGRTGHSSAGGDRFREELFDGVLAGLLGADVADHLLSRNLEGIVWTDYPMVGFVLAGELAEALAKAGDDRPGDLDEDDAEVIDAVLAALRKVADAGQDVVTVYA
ncbi:hypothetical protein AMES_5171 [Amycolatopsis mediterranei S699]|uniref:Uncharacterized protein n=2 Tax=Amycolatopsis mediterranei TaxID=33910 RepID=A0A0H3D8M3_AMYMU|nr:radical SAM protein [Amycolatopsis mediterranei]ADJ46996.1 hypothetical protein AMED_5233 [Amycolatopsis mediterranei U32]AEK43808.1 hypothetical protein RAM_26655 [Amycolatopsis mediterranei S699]AFO78707.1 hypothetical protein AMES_5171 [Amycolatopsis mediterranei S699]AGT85835.1 hypothetical protein B737_5171 [Amycolatopsis mediterranei RB]KDO04568.1 hypothetical protein DV26_42310 [Amycolatopsis mediterranei]